MGGAGEEPSEATRLKPGAVQVATKLEPLEAMEALRLEPGAVKDATVLDKIEADIDRVYYFRDHYFETHDLDEAIHKGARLKEKAQVKLNL